MKSIKFFLSEKFPFFVGGGGGGGCKMFNIFELNRRVFVMLIHVTRFV